MEPRPRRCAPGGANPGHPHYVLDTEQEFDRTVVDQFVDEYRHGRTPVPCLACNTELKFGSLLRRAGMGRGRRRHRPLRASHP